ncbi:mitochondrial uncoupling protein 2-like, partial [Phlebotomus argentipes]|uniref:mitochondrial uncoupling protein 2-like n=1 Tax=Phlebotomus argentipes TaxID=94469 RepID=UPI002892BFA4
REEAHLGGAIQLHGARRDGRKLPEGRPNGGAGRHGVRLVARRALYNGLSAGLQRQMAFASVRLGCYDTVKLLYQGVLHENPEGLQIFTRVLAGLTTGGMAVMLAQPTDVVKVRFQAQNRTTASPTAELIAEYN